MLDRGKLCIRPANTVAPAEAPEQRVEPAWLTLAMVRDGG